MAALSWLLNLGFAGGTGVVVADMSPTTIDLVGQNDTTISLVGQNDTTIDLTGQV